MTYEDFKALKPDAEKINLDELNQVAGGDGFGWCNFVDFGGDNKDDGKKYKCTVIGFPDIFDNCYAAGVIAGK